MDLIVRIIIYRFRNRFCETIFYVIDAGSKIAKRQISSSNLFQCTNGQRIDATNVCNGVTNCSDGSDETPSQCIKINCPSYSFRCTYGACVSRTAECNGRTYECADNSDELSQRCPAKSTSQLSGLCQQHQFQCDNGECILRYKLCDGHIDCTDGSDEIVKYCAAIPCPTYGFRCGYGGCIAGKLKCDRNVDCADGSDELHLICNYAENGSVFVPSATHRNPVTISTTIEVSSTRPTHFTNRPSTSRPTSSRPTSSRPTPSRPSNEAGCRVSVPESGDAIRASDNSVLRPNSLVNDLEMILYNCTQNHYSNGVTKNLCVSGVWQSPAPKCVPKCSPIIGITISANCFARVDGIEQQQNCENPSEPNTTAHIICQLGYERSGTMQIITCDRNGRWNPLPSKCTEICGKLGVKDENVKSTVDLTKVPWNVGIYKQLESAAHFEQHCSGTVISAKVVVSAIHCFWNTFENRRQNLSEFKVIAGKTWRDAIANEPFTAQFFSIDDVAYINNNIEQYRDFQGNYEFDVAVVILNQFIVYTNYIAPACLEYGLTYNELEVQDGLIGTVSGWGLQPNERRSEFLKVVHLPVVKNEQCKANTPSSFHPLITRDKFCAGHLNKITVCGGDSGAGFITAVNSTKGLVHYLRGIVSTGNKAPCSQSFLTTFTNVAYHSEFIYKYYLMYQPLL